LYAVDIKYGKRRGWTMTDQNEQKNNSSFEILDNDKDIDELFDWDFLEDVAPCDETESTTESEDQDFLDFDESFDLDDEVKYEASPAKEKNLGREGKNQPTTASALSKKNNLLAPTKVQINKAIGSIDTQKGDVKQFLELARISALCREGKHKLHASNTCIEIQGIDLLSAFIGNLEIEAAIAGHYNVIGKTVPYPPELMEYRADTLALLSPINYEIANSGDISDWKHAKEIDILTIDISNCAPILEATMCWNATEHKLVIKEFIDLNSLSPKIGDDADSELLKRCIQKFHQALVETPNEFERYKYKKQLQNTLNQEIINSKNNIRMGLDFCVSDSGSNKVKSVLTIIGPSESGKTMLAQSLFNASNSLFQTKENLLTIDCAQYVHENCISSFTGIDPFYRTPKQGFLTYQVEINPHSFIVFKNLNRSHPNLQRLVKDIIQNGFLSDITTERRISFKNTRIIISLDAETGNRTQPNNSNTDGFALLNDKKMQLDEGLSSTLSNYSILKTERLDATDSFTLCKRKLALVNKTFSNKYKLSPYMPATILIACGKNHLPSAIDHKISEIFEQIKQHSFDAIIEHDLHEASIKVQTSLLPRIAVIGMHKKLRGVNNVSIKHISAQQLQVPSQLDTFKIVVIANEAKSQLKQLKTLTLAKETTIIFVGSPRDLADKERPLVDSYIDTTLAAKSNTLCEQAISHYAVKRVQYYKRRQLAVTLKPTCHASNENNTVTIDYSTATESLSFAPEIYRHSFFKVLQPRERLDDVIGFQDVKEKIILILQQMNDYQSCSNPPPKGLVFEGPPGTGKTLLALAMAGESELNVITANASDLMANGIENINTLIDAAESIAPAIVFIDEFDAIGRKRDGQSVGYSAIVNTLLTRMDGSSKPEAPVLFVAATNYKEKLDPALLRAGRFEVSINFSLPDMPERITAVQQYAQQRSIFLNEQDARLLAILFEGETYKAIENTIAECTHKCEQKGKREGINLKDLIQHIYPKPELASEYDPKVEHMIYIKAYRLAGSIVTKQLVEPDTQAIYANVWHSSYFASSDRLEHYSYNNFRQDMLKLLAKRASEAIYCGDEKRCSAFTGKELEAIHVLASISVSAINLSEGDLRTELSNQQTSGNAESAFVRKTYKDVKDALRANWRMVENLANALLEKEELYEGDLQEILTQDEARIERYWH
jgi:cell division protease FtsH